MCERDRVNSKTYSTAGYLSRWNNHQLRRFCCCQDTIHTHTRTPHTPHTHTTHTQDNTLACAHSLQQPSKRQPELGESPIGSSLHVSWEFAFQHGIRQTTVGDLGMKSQGTCCRRRQDLVDWWESDGLSKYYYQCGKLVPSKETQLARSCLSCVCDLLHYLLVLFQSCHLHQGLWLLVDIAVMCAGYRVWSCSWANNSDHLNSLHQRHLYRISSVWHT